MKRQCLQVECVTQFLLHAAAAEDKSGGLYAETANSVCEGGITDFDILLGEADGRRFVRLRIGDRIAIAFNDNELWAQLFEIRRIEDLTKRLAKAKSESPTRPEYKGGGENLRLWAAAEQEPIPVFILRFTTSCYWNTVRVMDPSGQQVKPPNNELRPLAKGYTQIFDREYGNRLRESKCGT